MINMFRLVVVKLILFKNFRCQSLGLTTRSPSCDGHGYHQPTLNQLNWLSSLNQQKCAIVSSDKRNGRKGQKEREK